MKTMRFLLAAVIVMAASACSGDVTAPEPAALAPAGGSSSTAPASDAETETESDGTSSGLVGSIGG